MLCILFFWKELASQNASCIHDVLFDLISSSGEFLSQHVHSHFGHRDAAHVHVYTSPFLRCLQVRVFFLSAINIFFPWCFSSPAASMNSTILQNLFDSTTCSFILLHLSPFQTSQGICSALDCHFQVFNPLCELISDHDFTDHPESYLPHSRLPDADFSAAFPRARLDLVCNEKINS